MITLHFLLGVPDMPHTFGCEATEVFGPPVKDFALAVSVGILDGASIDQILKGVGASTVQ